MSSIRSNRGIAVAPMMAYTDRHCRYLHRLLEPSVTLFTEMVTAQALLHGDADRSLRHRSVEYPLALQLGGSDPEELAKACAIAAPRGFVEINLNVGCPSDRVQQGRFGACLMLEPERVADCLAAMREASSVPVTAKCRLGVDKQDHPDFLERFINVTRQSGCTRYYVHARVAWLKGLSPAQNRSVPPLKYDQVYDLQANHPELDIWLNGGLTRTEEVETAWQSVGGVMIGRAAYQNPFWLRELAACAQDRPVDALSLNSVLDQYRLYVEDELARGTPLTLLTKPLLGLANGRPGARHFRRTLSDQASLRKHGADSIELAVQTLERHAA